MSFFSHLGRPRTIVLAAASLLLHYVAVGWVNANVKPLSGAPVQPARTIVAQLRAASAAAPPPRVQAAPPARPAPARRTRGAPGTRASALALAPAEPAGAPLPAAEMLEPELALAPLPEAEIAPAAAAQPEKEATPEQRRYKVDLLPSARLLLDVARTDARGKEYTGAGSMDWSTDGASYRVTVEAGVSMLVTRLNLLVSTSEGGVGEHGLAPLRFTEKRLSRAQTATHFRREEQRITYSASERSDPLAPGAQDKASVPFQLAGIGRADPAQLAGDVEIQVGGEKDAEVYRFVLVGEEELETAAFGILRTVHLARPPRPGSYNSRLDIWFAPSLGWYPVLIRNTEASGAVTTQAVSKIETSAGN